MSISQQFISLAKSLVERFPRIAAMYRSVRDQLAYTKEPITTSWGFKLAGNTAMALGTIEPVETELVRNRISAITVVTR